MVVKYCIFVVSCSDVGIYDRVVIQELLKNMAQAQQLDKDSQKDFKGKQHDDHSGETMSLADKFYACVCFPFVKGEKNVHLFIRHLGFNL